MLKLKKLTKHNKTDEDTKLDILMRDIDGILRPSREVNRMPRLPKELRERLKAEHIILGIAQNKVGRG